MKIMIDKKEKLIHIEQEIIKITGDDINVYSKWEKDKYKRNRVGGLLCDRQRILNEMFIPSEDNFKLFIEVNDRLNKLTQNLFSRVKSLISKRSILFDCPDFDDDYEIEGTLCYVFNDEDSVLALPDDSVYGSNFPLMIKNVYEYSKETWLENIESIHEYSEPLDDGLTWNNYPFYGRKEFEGIIICHAIHHLTNHQAFSIPDLLRLNDFWAEVNLKIQSITDQKGERYKGKIELPDNM